MLLTKKDLEEYQVCTRTYIPEKLAKKLLIIYGNYALDDEGHLHEYTEQDIYEQIRKIIRDYRE